MRNRQGMRVLAPIKNNYNYLTGVIAILILAFFFLLTGYKMKNFNAGNWEGNELAYQYIKFSDDRGNL